MSLRRKPSISTTATVRPLPRMPRRWSAAWPNAARYWFGVKADRGRCHPRFPGRAARRRCRSGASASPGRPAGRLRGRPAPSVAVERKAPGLVLSRPTVATCRRSAAGTLRPAAGSGWKRWPPRRAAATARRCRSAPGPARRRRSARPSPQAAGRQPAQRRAALPRRGAEALDQLLHRRVVPVAGRGRVGDRVDEAAEPAGMVEEEEGFDVAVRGGGRGGGRCCRRQGQQARASAAQARAIDARSRRLIPAAAPPARSAARRRRRGAPPSPAPPGRRPARSCCGRG